MVISINIFLVDTIIKESSTTSEPGSKDKYKDVPKMTQVNLKKNNEICNFLPYKLVIYL